MSRSPTKMLCKWIAGVVALPAIAACGGPSVHSALPSRSVPSPASTMVDAAFASKAFVLPFELDVPHWLPAKPSTDEPRFLTWLGEDEYVDRAVRFLVPVSVYVPGTAAATPVPAAYVDYLLSQTQHGGHLAEESETTVGGWPATIFTATADQDLDGSLGCPADDIAASDCFGLQAALALRIAVIDVDGTILLAWARAIPGNAENVDEFADFEHMLASLRFR